MDPFEDRLKSLKLRAPSASFGRPETLAEVLNSVPQPKQNLLQRLPWVTKAAALLGLAAAILLTIFIFSSPSGTSIAFAQVVEKITSAKTLSLDLTATYSSKKQPPIKARMMFLEPYKMRVDARDGKDDVMLATLITDLKAGKSLLLSPKIHLGIAGWIKVGDKTELQDSMIDDIRSLAKKSTRSLGKKEIDGITAEGFEIDNDGMKICVWADAKTGNPIRMEMNEFMLPPPLGKSNVVLSNFQVDAPLDPALFNVEAPAGYLVIPSPIEIDITAKPTEFVVTMLKYYAQHTDGRFPDRLDEDWEPIFKKFAPDAVKVENNQIKESDETEFRLVRLAVTQLLTYSYGHKSGRDYQYLPGGKLGEKDRIVFWYRDDKTGEYSAVYGDLRVEKVAQDQLPGMAHDGQK